MVWHVCVPSPRRVKADEESLLWKPKSLRWLGALTCTVTVTVTVTVHAKTRVERTTLYSTWYCKVATRAALQGEKFSSSLLQRAQKRAVSREKKNKAREAEECEATPLAIRSALPRPPRVQHAEWSWLVQSDYRGRTGPIESVT